MPKEGKRKRGRFRKRYRDKLDSFDKDWRNCAPEPENVEGKGRAISCQGNKNYRMTMCVFNLEPFTIYYKVVLQVTGNYFREQCCVETQRRFVNIDWIFNANEY